MARSKVVAVILLRGIVRTKLVKRSIFTKRYILKILVRINCPNRSIAMIVSCSVSWNYFKWFECFRNFPYFVPQVVKDRTVS